MISTLVETWVNYKVEIKGLTATILAIGGAPFLEKLDGYGKVAAPLVTICAAIIGLFTVMKMIDVWWQNREKSGFYHLIRWLIRRR